MRHPLRRLAPAALVLCTLPLSGCGDDPAPTPAPNAEVADTPADATPPYRETIDPARTAKVATRTLPKRDQALAVGDTVPAFEALPGGKPTLVVFYRGHW